MDGSLTAVICEPTEIANSEAIIPASGPATAKSNRAALFLGGDLNVVTELVIPVMMEGTKVGALVLICFVSHSKRKKCDHCEESYFSLACARRTRRKYNTKTYTIGSGNHDMSKFMSQLDSNKCCKQWKGIIG